MKIMVKYHKFEYVWTYECFFINQFNKHIIYYWLLQNFVVHQPNLEHHHLLPQQFYPFIFLSIKEKLFKNNFFNIFCSHYIFQKTELFWSNVLNDFRHKFHKWFSFRNSENSESVTLNGGLNWFHNFYYILNLLVL
jgi:hypothetical protein